MSRFDSLMKGTAFAAVLSLCLLTPPASAQTVVQLSGRNSHLSANALRQIDALEREKATRTPAQSRINSNLLYTLKMARGEQIAPGVTQLRTGVDTNAAGLTLVDMDATVSAALLQAIVRVGGTVVHASPAFSSVRASVPVSALEMLASVPGVHFIKPAAKAMLNNPGSALKRRADMLAPFVLPVPERVSLQQREVSVRTQLPALLARVGANLGGATPATGSVTSEGDKAHQADKARSTYGVSGSGIKVGVLSDSIDDPNGSYAAAVSSGDVSSVTVISGQQGPSSGEGEGLAMLEIVHDLAPSAKLYFASGFNGEASMADNIVALQQAGCKVIIDDVSYFDEPAFQDGVIAKAVNTVTAAGVMFFSSAANYGNRLNSTSSVWEGDFKDSGDTHSGEKLHDFTGGGGEGNEVQLSGSSANISLFWADALGKSSNDYDLYIFDNTGSTVVASSTNSQTGTQDPYEQAQASNGDLVAIALYSGSTRFLHVDINAQHSIFNYATNGRTRGHNAGLNTFSCAATPAADNQNGDPQGPYPGSFSTSDSAETFSSDGLRRIFFNPDGSAITSGNFTHTGGSALKKPDFTAADGVTTTLPSDSGLNPFFGTSAAAPHAGAIAALMLSKNSSLTRAQVASILDGNVFDIEASGYDVTSGYGIINALNAVKNTPTSSGSVVPKSLSFTPNPVVGGQATTGTITLTGAAPTGGAAVTITENGSSIGNITVPAGSTSVTFTLTPPAVTATETDTIGAAYNGTTVTTSLTVTPAPSGSAPTITSLSPSSATAGGAAFTLTVNGTNFISGSIVKWNGASQTTTFVSATKLTASISASLIASAGTATVTVTTPHVGTSAGKTFTINASTASAPVLSSISPTTRTAGGGQFVLTANGSNFISGSVIKWNGATQTTTFVSSTKLTATIPASLITTAGTAAITVTTPHVGTSGSKTLTINPAASSAILTKLSFNPASISSNGETVGTVTLSSAAPSGGAPVVISYAGSAILTVTVLAGNTSATFSLDFPTVTAKTVYQIDATYSGVTKSANVTVNTTSVKPSKLAFSPSTVTGSATTTGTVTLTAAAPAGGAVVTITQDGTSIGNVFVAAGNTTVTFTYQPGPVSVQATYTMGALYNGKTVTANLTAKP